MRATCIGKLQKLYRFTFWSGYIAVLITAFLPVSIKVVMIRLGPEAFRIRSDHLLHFAVYFVICMYYLAAAIKGLSLFSVKPLTKFFLLLMFLGVVTEIVQLWTPGRVFNVFDLVSNVSGVAIGMGVVLISQRYKGITA